MKENPTENPLCADDLPEAALKETEELLRSFRLSPVPTPVKARMHFTLLQQRSRSLTRFRYQAAAASLVLLAVSALGLPAAGDTAPAYVPLCACTAGLLLLTAPSGRLKVGHCRIL